jgi:hypothetical protein
MGMTSYIRFFHIETHHWSLLLIEFLVTIATLVFFAMMPARRLAFFPNRSFRTFALKRSRACLLIFLLSIFGRIAILPVEPFPPPRVQDEFSYLLASETFAHGRLTNPTPVNWHHFEAFHVLMQPTYMSKYGPAAPLFMAIGERLFGTPRAGVVFNMALAAASLCWMLQAYLPAEWALLGGLIAVVRISWFSYFGNAYWGGAAAMLGGCLLLAAPPDLPDGRGRASDCSWRLGYSFWRTRVHLKAVCLPCLSASIPCGCYCASARVLASGFPASSFYCWDLSGRAITVTASRGVLCFPGWCTGNSGAWLRPFSSASQTIPIITNFRNSSVITAMEICCLTQLSMV